MFDGPVTDEAETKNPGAILEGFDGYTIERTRFGSRNSWS